MMNGDIQAVRKLLSELREAYESLPKHLQLRVIYLLRESALPEERENQEPLDRTFRAPGQLRAFFKQRQSPNWSRDCAANLLDHRRAEGVRVENSKHQVETTENSTGG